MRLLGALLDRLGARLPRDWVFTRRTGLVALAMVPGAATYFGVQFDVAWHIDYGRDHFTIPPHLVMSAGVALGGTVLAALAVIATGVVRAGGRVALPMRERRGVPYSPLNLIAVACFATPGIVIGIDEGWHEIFGLDVSAWSPTHLTALYTAAFAGLATACFLAAELNRTVPGRAAAGLRRLRDLDRRELWLLYSIGLFGAGLLVMLIEYDFDVPQFDLGFYPPLLAALTAFPIFAGMTALGTRFGAGLIGGAIVGFKGAVLLALIALGRTRPDLPAGIVAAALAVDGVVLAGGDRRRRGAMVAALAVYPVALIGCEWLRLTLLDQPRWTAGLWPLGAPLAVPAGMIAGALGLWAGWSLRPAARPLPAPAPGKAARLGRLLAPAGLLVLLLTGPAVPAAVAKIYTRDVVFSHLRVSPAHPAPGGEVRMRLTVDPRSIGGNPPPFLDASRRELGAFRAGTRLRAPLRRTGPRSFEGRLRLGAAGHWVIWPKFKLPGERWIDREEILVQAGGPVGGTRTYLTALGPEADPDNAPQWLRPFGFGVMAAIWLAVTAGIVLSLRLVSRFGFSEEAPG